MGNDVRTITLEQLADGAADRPLLSEGAEIDSPMLTVNLDGAADPVTCVRAADRARVSDRILVGLHHGGRELSPDVQKVASALDTTLVAESAPGNRVAVSVPDPDVAVGELHRKVAENPHSTLVLAQVLKLSEHLTAPAAIDVESLAYSTLLGARSFVDGSSSEGRACCRHPRRRNRCWSGGRTTSFWSL